MVESAPPHQSVVRLFFLSCFFFRSSNFEFPARIRKGGGGKTHRTPYFLYVVNSRNITHLQGLPTIRHQAPREKPDNLAL
jgi:hypothetical protein